MLFVIGSWSMNTEVYFPSRNYSSFPPPEKLEKIIPVYKIFLGWFVATECECRREGL